MPHPSATRPIAAMSMRCIAIIAEGVPEWLKNATLGKFRPDGILMVHAGGGAGLFSASIGGWANGDVGSKPVTREVTP